MSYFDVTMQFTSIVDGKTKKQKAKFLIETETFGNAEQKAFGELGDNERDAVCCSIGHAKINEVIKVGDGALWFKVNYSTTITDDNGKEKTAKFILLIDADNIADATERANDHLSNHWDDVKIFKVEDGKYADVLEYEKATATMKPKAITMACAFESDAVEALNKTAAKLFPNNGMVTEFKAIDPTDGKYIDSLLQWPNKAIEAERRKLVEELKNAPPTPFARKPDPTDGQAVAFPVNLNQKGDKFVYIQDGGMSDNADPLRLLMESFGLSMTDDQLEEIEEMHEACGTVEFSEFMESEHGLSLGDAVLVSNLLMK